MAKSGARTFKWPPQRFMSMEMVRTGNRSHWVVFSGLISYVAILKCFLVERLGCLGSTPVYRRLIAAEADEALRLISDAGGSSTPFSFHLNQILAETIVSCVEDIVKLPHVLHLRTKNRKKLLKEFYRIVKEATNLMRLCCNEELWLMTAFCMVESRETFSLRCSELLWFKKVVKSSNSTDWLQKRDWHFRWEAAVLEDHTNLQENVKEVNQDVSTKEFHLAWNLSRRLAVTQASTESGAQNGVMYLNLEGLNLQEDKPLGTGASAKVYKATWRGEVFAVKKFCGSNPELAAKEASIATKLHHPNVVPILGCLQVHGGANALLMELMSSSLTSYVQANNVSTRFSGRKITPFQPLVAVDMILQIAEGMRYLHKENIAHLDLKAENILVNFVSDSYLAQEGYVNLKIVDFGTSRNNVKSSTSLYESFVGTTLYRAPEIRAGQYSRTVDIYGFAIVSYQIMTGNEPFPKPESYAEFNEKVRNGYRPKWRSRDPYPSALKTLVEECWSGDADKRPDFATICIRLRRIKGFLITDSYDGFEEPTVHEESMDQASEGGFEQDMLEPYAYFLHSRDAAQRIFDLTSLWDEHTHLNKMQCSLLVECLRKSMDAVNEKHSSSDGPFASVITLTEFYRIVIACEKLILQCCNQNWQRAAIWLMDCKETFFLRISELFWCTGIVTKTAFEGNFRRQFAAFTTRMDVISQRLSVCAEKDLRLLKLMLKNLSVVEHFRFNSDLVSYLSRRADARTEVVAFPPNLLSTEVDPIGTGGVGNVYKAIMFNESVAIKVYQKDHANPKWKDMHRSEASVMAKLNHPGIVPLIGVTSGPNSYSLIMELMSGDLLTLIRIRSQGGLVSPFSLHVCVDIMLQIGEAVQHVHDVGLAHRDLKPANILFKVVEDERLTKEGFVVVKLADFGLANESREWELSENWTGNVGSIRYMAPELYRGGSFRKGRDRDTLQIHKSNTVDVYSFSMVCYEILSGKEPFDTKLDATEIKKGVLDGERPPLPPTCPSLLASLIQQCWHTSPSFRPSFTKICVDLRHIRTMIITGSLSSIHFQYL